MSPSLEEVLRQVFQHSLDGIVITDPATVVVDLNPAYERITGWPRQELLGRPVGIIKSGRTSPATYQDMWDSLDRRRQWIGTLINRRKDGEET